METQFTNTFFDSLKRLSMQQTWWYKTYSAIRYDIPHFIKNIYRFRKELYSHDWWDYRFTLDMLERSLTIMEAGLSKKGIEVSESREPKLKDWLFEETEDGLHRLIDSETQKDKAHNRRVYKRGVAIEQAEWNELWTIIKGTKNSMKYGEEYDGTDLRGWWD
jgi:hypothetical protein